MFPKNESDLAPRTSYRKHAIAIDKRQWADAKIFLPSIPEISFPTKKGRNVSPILRNSSMNAKPSCTIEKGFLVSEVVTII